MRGDVHPAALNCLARLRAKSLVLFERTRIHRMNREQVQRIVLEDRDQAARTRDPVQLPLTSVLRGTTCLSPMAMAKTTPIRSNRIGASPSRAADPGGERREAAENSEAMGPSCEEVVRRWRMGVNARFANGPGRIDAWRNIHESLKPAS
jgi:hypothetical protein